MEDLGQRGQHGTLSVPLLYTHDCLPHVSLLLVHGYADRLQLAYLLNARLAVDIVKVAVIAFVRHCL